MVTDVIDYVTVSDTVDAIDFTEDKDKVSVSDTPDGVITVVEVVEKFAVSDANDAFEITDANDQVKTVEDAAIVIQKTIIVEPEEDVPLIIQVDFVGDDLIYKAWADPNSLTSNPVWKIQRIEFVGVDEDVVILWADSGQYTQIWDDRASLSYS